MNANSTQLARARAIPHGLGLLATLFDFKSPRRIYNFVYLGSRFEQCLNDFAASPFGGKIKQERRTASLEIRICAKGEKRIYR